MAEHTSVLTLTNITHTRGERENKRHTISSGLSYRLQENPRHIKPRYGMSWQNIPTTIIFP